MRIVDPPTFATTGQKILRIESVTMKRRDKLKSEVPTSLQVNAVASEAGILEWRQQGKLKHERNELHELASRIRKNTGRAIEKFIKLKPLAMVLATDDTSKGRGFSSLHILMRSLGLWSEGLETVEKVNKTNYVKWHLEAMEKYLITIDKSAREQLMNTKNHDGRTPLFILLQQKFLTDKHVELCANLCPGSFCRFCTYNFLPVRALVRNSCMTLQMIKVYVDAVRISSKQSNSSKNFLFLPDRTKRKRTPLHELVLSNHCTQDILIYWLQTASTDAKSGWWHFMHEKDGHGNTAFELSMLNKDLMTHSLLKVLLKNNSKKQENLQISRIALNNLVKNKTRTPEMLRAVFSYEQNRIPIKNLASVPDEMADTLLHVLAGSENIRREHFLIYFKKMNKRDLCKTDRNGDTPFHIYGANTAALDKDTIQCLLENVDQATFTQTDKYGDNILHILMRNPKITPKIVRLVCNHKRTKHLLVVQNKKNLRRTALHELCLNVRVTSRLVTEYMKCAPKAGTILDALGKSPLSLLCGDSKAVDGKIVGLFLQNKEVLSNEIKSRDKDGHHSLHSLLRHNVQAPYSQIKAAVSKFVDLVLPKLKGSSADYFHNLVNTKDMAFLWRRDTPLIQMCKAKPRISLQALKSQFVKNAENFSAMQANGRTSFHEILGNSIGLNEEILQLYCKYASNAVIGELLNALDNYGESPLFILARNKRCTENMMMTLNRYCTTEKLFQATEVRNLHGENALHILCKQRFVSDNTLGAYLSFTSPKSMFDTDDNGRTPLHVLSRNPDASTRCFEKLLKRMRSSKIYTSNTMLLEDKHGMNPLLCLVRRAQPPSADDINVFLEKGQDKGAIKALTIETARHESPLRHLARRIQEERVARGVLNKCLELWTASSGQNRFDFGVQELRNQLMTFDVKNGENSDQDLITKTPLQYVLGKTDETSLPAHDKALSIARKKPYVVVQSVPEQDLHQTYDLGSEIGDELFSKKELTYEEQKVIIRKLKRQVIHQQLIIEKLRGEVKVEVDPESDTVPSVPVSSP